MSHTTENLSHNDLNAWFDFAATGDDWGLEQLRHFVGQRDPLGRTALMHYVGNGWYKRVYLFADEVRLCDADGDDALVYAKRASNEEAIHRINMLLKDSKRKTNK